MLYQPKFSDSYFLPTADSDYHTQLFRCVPGVWVQVFMLQLGALYLLTEPSPQPRDWHSFECLHWAYIYEHNTAGLYIFRQWAFLNHVTWNWLYVTIIYGMLYHHLLPYLLTCLPAYPFFHVSLMGVHTMQFTSYLHISLCLLYPPVSSLPVQ